MKMLVLVLVAFAARWAHIKAEPALIDYGYESGKDIHTMFKEYVEEYKREYTPAQYEARFLVFKKNVDHIISHNRKQNVTYTKGINQFTDMTPKEFTEQVVSKGYKATPKRKMHFKTLKPTTEESIDWTTKTCGGGPCVTPVKNQAQCGSCWAFSATGCLEARTAILADEPVSSLSEQQLVDCSHPEGNDGCEGGLMDYAFQYVHDNGGLCPEDFYVYRAEDQTCHKNFVTHCKKNHEVVGFHDVPHQSEEQLKAAVNQGPVSVAIEADQMIFQTYRSGVITGNCGTQLDHGVLVVGYGTANIQGQKVDYWKVKNSWTASWGDHGYVLIGRNTGKANGECGILMSPSYPNLKTTNTTKN